MPVTAPKAQGDHSRNGADQTPAAQLATQPFVRSAPQHTELLDYDTSKQLTTSSQGPYVLEMPATGYFDSALLQVDVTGAAGAATPNGDYPFSLFDYLDLTDVGGQDLIEQLTGYEMYLIAKYGGYDFFPDPKLKRSYSAPDASGNCSFQLRVPVAIGQDGLGVLDNTNAKQTYKIHHRLAAAAAAFTAVPATTLPTVRVRGIYEGFLQPNDGNTPPHQGVIQNWSKQVYNIPATGAQTITLQRVGAAIRNLIFVYRDASGVRQDTIAPDQLEIVVDNRPHRINTQAYRQHVLSDRFGFAASNYDIGVEVETFDHENGHPGLMEMNDLWLQTTQATKLQIKGAFRGTGTLTVLTNDVIVPAAVAAA
jgi:hypothetical protein